MVADLNTIRRSAVGINLGGIFSGRNSLFLVTALVLGVVVLLLVVIVGIAFRDSDTNANTLENFRELYGDRFVLTALRNTIGFTLVATFTSLFFAVPIAFLAERTTLPGRSFIFPLLTVTILIPGFFSAMGWLLMFHPRIGMMNKWAVEYIPFINSPPFNVATVTGMGFITGLGLSSLAFIMLAGTFRAMDPTLEESAQIHGMGLVTRLRKITFPLLWPGILAAGLYITTIALASFDVPAFIGLANRIFTFSTMLFILANPEDGLPQYGLIGASSVMMIVIALFLSWWYLSVIRRSHKYAVVTGKNYRPKLIVLNRKWIVAGWTFIAVKLLFSFIVPLLMLIWTSLIPFFEPISASAIQRVSLDNYRDIPWPAFWQVARNTAILVAVVPTLSVVIGMAISWVVIRSKSRGAWLVDTLAFLPHAVPNLIFAVAAVYLALVWIPRWIPFYGTMYILIVVFVIARISFPTRLYNNALLQIHKELDEAGYVFGLGALRVLRRITFPLLLPTIMYSWLWMALLTYRELTLGAFLQARDNVTLPVYIFTIFRSGETPIAAALSLVLLLFLMPLITIYFVWARRQGVVA